MSENNQNKYLGSFVGVGWDLLRWYAEAQKSDEGSAGGRP